MATTPPPIGGGAAFAPITPPSATAPNERAPLWPWFLGAIMLAALAGGGWLWFRRRAEAPLTITFERPIVPATAEPEDESAATAPAEAEPTPAVPAPAFGVPLVLALEATRMSATLLNTTLAYSLVVTNTGPDPLGPLTVSGDMIAAHATMPAEAQLGDGHDLPERHRLPPLAPGESATLNGEMRLPLASIVPIRQGAAALFVPLVRFRVDAERDGQPPLTLVGNYVVGEPPAAPNTGLRPFRLDLGPRIYAPIAQRQLAA
ncbi:MAG: DUF11 domain-containing protein [Novosphingobium sp.]|nr:DUF11 domain-containing protein [Novosphingobium sp.]